MRNFLASAMVITMALCVFAAVIPLGGVTPDLAIFSYGLGAILALAWVVKLFFADVVSWKQSPLHWPVVAFFVYAIGRYFTAPIEYDARLELLNVGFYTLIYFLCAANFHRSRDRTVFIVALMVLATIEAGYGFWQFWTKADIVLSYLRPKIYHGRASGTYICPNHFAGLLEMLAALMIARMALWHPSKTAVQRSVLQKVFIAYAAFMAMAGLILSLSRAGWVAMIVALFSFLLWGEWEWRRIAPRLAAGVLGIGLIIFAAFYINPVRHYILMTFDETSQSKPLTLTDATLGSRTIMWQDTVRMVRDYPVFGLGPGAWQWYHPAYRPKELQDYPEFAHNDVLHLASDYGLVGWVLVFAALICFFRHAAVFVPSANSSDHRSFAVGAGVGVTAILVHSWFDFNLHIPANALLLASMMGFTVAMEDKVERYPRAVIGRVPRIAIGLVVLALTCAGGWLAARTALASHYGNQGERSKSFLYWDDAIAFYKRAIATDPRFPEPYARIADIYRTQSFWRRDPERKEEREELARQAIEYYQKSLQLNPRQIPALVGLAKAYDLTNDPAEAVRTYERAIIFSPTSAYLYQELGLFYRRHGDDQKALAALEKSQSLHYGYTAALNIQEIKSQ